MVDFKKRGEEIFDYFDSQKEKNGQKEAVSSSWDHLFRGITSTSIFAGSCFMGGVLAAPVIVPVATGLALVAWQLSHTKKGQELKRAERAALKVTVGKNKTEMTMKQTNAQQASCLSSQLQAMRLRELNEALDKLQEYVPFCFQSGNSFSYSGGFVGKKAYRKILCSYGGPLYYKVGDKKGFIDRAPGQDIPTQIDDLLNSPEFEQGKVEFFKDSDCCNPFTTPQLQVLVQKKQEKIQKYIDIVKAYGIVPDAEFYANGHKQDELEAAYKKLDPWCRHDIGDDPASLSEAIKNSIKQGFEEEARKVDTNGNYDDTLLKTMFEENKRENSSNSQPKYKKWVACEGSDGTTEIPEKSGKYYKLCEETEDEFWEKRLKEGSEKYLVTMQDDTSNTPTLTEAEKKFVQEKAEELQKPWAILRSHGGFQGIPGVAREKAVKILRDLKKQNFDKKYNDVMEGIEGDVSFFGMEGPEKNAWIEGRITQNPVPSPSGFRQKETLDPENHIYKSHKDFLDKFRTLVKLGFSYADIQYFINEGPPISEEHSLIQERIPGDVIVSKVARRQAIEEAVKTNLEADTPAKKLYIQNGGDVSKWDDLKYAANITGTATKTLAGMGSMACLGCLIAAAPILGTCGAIVSLPYALAYGRNVYKSWQNTARQSAYRKAKRAYRDF